MNNCVLQKSPETEIPDEIQKIFKLQDSGDYEQAIKLCDMLTEKHPKDIRPKHAKVQSLLLLRKPKECIPALISILKLKGDDYVALNNLGVAYEQLDDLNMALDCYSAALGLNPTYLDAALNRAVCLQRLELLEEAEYAYRTAIEINHESAAGFFGLGNILMARQKPSEAIQSYERALELNKNFGLAWYNIGNSKLTLGDTEGAIQAFHKTIEILPEYGPAYNNYGSALKELKLHDEAVRFFIAATHVDPNLTDAFFNQSVAFNLLGRHLEALEACREVIERVPDYPGIYLNLGVALLGLNQYQAATDSFEKAIVADPNQASGYVNKAHALESTDRHEDVIKAYSQGYQIDPKFPYLASRLAYKKLYVCDWNSSSEIIKDIINKIELRERVCDPFRLIAFSDETRLQRICAEVWQESHLIPRNSPTPLKAYARHKRIRVGYYSADFHLHATAILMAELFELHDREKFEIFAFSFGPPSQDRMRQRLTRAFEHFIDVSNKDPLEIAKLSREYEIDIAIDLKGYTLFNRMDIFASRAAPVQISYLGYPGTLGGSYMDYLVADHHIIKEDQREYYSEKIIYLPDCYQINDSKRVSNFKDLSRSDVGLPEDAFVYCSFNNNYKITPEVFEIWMKILNKTENSVLWLLSDSSTVQNNISNECKKYNIDPDRVIFAKRTDSETHLGRQRLADLLLDTFPCNAHTTASDALWVGLPVISISGNSFASRVCGSLLKAVGLPELIVNSMEEYFELAVKLYDDKSLLETYRGRLEKSARTSALFDSVKFTRNFERALVDVYERSQLGEEPSDLHL